MENKTLLITAGQVYGRLDDNKLVGNRSRGIWAIKFANEFACEHNKYLVKLLLPDTFPIKLLVPSILRDENVLFDPEYRNIEIILHTGFQDYMEKCLALAPEIDAAIMAAAVVNWIPAEPIRGKMTTEGYSAGDIVNIPFMLAPHVIDKMKAAAGKPITLIGCKMTSGAEQETTIAAAKKTLFDAGCHVVLANDLQFLKNKMLVFPDGNVSYYYNEFEALFEDLMSIIDDGHWMTSHICLQPPPTIPMEVKFLFDRVVEKYRSRFVRTVDGRDLVFGSLAINLKNGHYLVSPRKKGEMFSSDNSVIVSGVNTHSNTIFVQDQYLKNTKASLNAPLLIRQLQENGEDYFIVLHLHEQLDGVQVLPYSPPGTVRDNNRIIPKGRKSFNIEGHGFVALLDNELEIMK